MWSRSIVHLRSSRQVIGRRAFSMPGLPMGPPPAANQQQKGKNRFGFTLKIIGGFLFLNTLAGLGRLSEEKKVLRQNLFQTQAELERLVKILEDESLYEELTTELRYTQNKQSEVVREILSERLAGPMKTLVEKADKALLSTDRNPQDKDARAKAKEKYFEKKAAAAANKGLESEGEGDVSSTSAGTMDEFKPDDFSSSSNNNNNSNDSSNEKW